MHPEATQAPVGGARVREATMLPRVRELVGQIRVAAPVVAGLVLAIAALDLVLFAVHRTTGIPLRYFTRDPVETVYELTHQAPFYLGAVSYLGIVGWCVAGTVCLFVAGLLARRSRGDGVVAFLIGTGLVPLVLMLDDLFLLHEEVLPNRLHVPERVVLAAYAMLVAGYVARFLPRILGTNLLLLALSFLAFAASLAVDQLPNPFPPGSIARSAYRPLVEDGTKLLGILLFAAYCIDTAASTIARRLASPLPRPIGPSATPALDSPPWPRASSSSSPSRRRAR
jgi:hypothetical protein